MSAWGKSTLIKLELYAFMGLSAGRLGVPIWSTVQAKSRNGCSLKTKKIGTSIWTLKSGYRWLAAGSSQSWRWGVAKRLTMGPQRDENTITSLFPSFCFHPPWSTSLSPSQSPTLFISLNETSKHLFSLSLALVRWPFVLPTDGTQNFGQFFCNLVDTSFEYIAGHKTDSYWQQWPS